MDVLWMQDLSDMTHLCDSCWRITHHFHRLYEMVQKSHIEKRMVKEALSDIVYYDVEILDDFGMLPADDDCPTSSLLSGAEPTAMPPVECHDVTAKTPAPDQQDQLIDKLPPLVALDDSPISTQTTTSIPVPDAPQPIEFFDINNIMMTLGSSTLAKPTAAANRPPPPTSGQRRTQRPPVEFCEYPPPSAASTAEIVADVQVSSGGAVVPKKSTTRQVTKITDEVNARIRSVLPTIACEVCATEFTSIADVTGHYRREHSRSGFVRCCGMMYMSVKLLLNHIGQVHENPNAQCAFCSYGSLSERSMLLHLEREHAVFGEFTEFSCETCTTM